MKERLRKMLDKTFAIGGGFLLCFFLIRVFSWWSISGRMGELSQVGLQVQGFLEDLSVGIIILLLIGAIGEFIAILSVEAAVALEIILLVSLLITSFGINQFFVVTLVPLSTDIFGYTLNDVLLTVKSSDTTNEGSIVKLIFILLVFGLTVYFLLKRNYFEQATQRTKLLILIAFVLFTFLPVRAIPEDFENDLSYYIKMNKLWYLSGKSWEYWSDDSKPITFAEGTYPLMHRVNFNDSLSNYFNKVEGYPNLVFIIVEGLGRDFSGSQAPYGGFTPFLDSLSQKSLYWQNAISNAGRTFGAPPSILGSLPYGKLGLMGYGNEMPNHQTLLTLLKPYGYQSNFFYGGNPNFDNLDLFLEQQGIDFFLNESNFPTGNKKDFWGYNDALLFKAGIDKTQNENNNRLDVYLTLSTHEPFACPDSSLKLRADKMIEKFANEKRKQIVQSNKNIFECLLYTDNAIKTFFNSFSKRSDFAKTIFVITGDHRLIPIPQDNKIKRFHVPLIIYSPLLKQTQTFSSVVAHSSILPSFLSLLHNQYAMSFPDELPIISETISLNKKFSSSLHIPLIRNKNEVNDFVSGNYFLSDNRLYLIRDGLQLQVEDNPEIKDKIKNELREFQAKSLYAINNNRLDKISGQSRYLFPFAKDEEKYLADEKISLLDPDQKFNKAQLLARADDYKHCRTVLKSILNKSPNYHDARNLMARTYAWQKNYDSAKLFLHQTMERSPNYADTYAALADIDFWQNKLPESLQDVEIGLNSNSMEPELLCRKARVLLAMNKNAEAKKIMNGLIQSGFENEIVIQLKTKLK